MDDVPFLDSFAQIASLLNAPSPLASLALYERPDSKKLFSPDLRTYTMNFGPQHPAAHGVLRLVLEMDGEIVIHCDPHIGLLHRGTEKLIESRNFLQALPYFDRLDYVSTLSQEHSYCLAVERLFLRSPSTYPSLVRMVLLELTRILNHLMAITTHALDVGALTPFLWGFEEREKIMEFFERLSGARLHTAFFRPGGIASFPPDGLLEDIFRFADHFLDRLHEIEALLSSNRIWNLRLDGVGVVKFEDALAYSFTGPMARGSGLPWDCRFHSPYELYDHPPFSLMSLPVGIRGDCYDRYLVRMAEMFNSASLCLSLSSIALSSISEPAGPVSYAPSLPDSKGTMEGLIDHFKYYSSYPPSPRSSSFAVSEAPKGEFGVFLVSDGGSGPYRCRIRAPGFFHLQSLDSMARGHSLADLVAIIGTQDVVFGEIDR